MYGRKWGASAKTHALLNRICLKDRPIFAPTVEVTSKDDQGGVRAISPAQDIVQ